MKKEVYMVISSTTGQSATVVDYITDSYDDLLIHLYFKLKSKTEYKNYSANKAIKEIVLKLPMRQQISEKLMKGNKDRFVKIKWIEVLNVQRKIRNDKIDEILK